MLSGGWKGLLCLRYSIIDSDFARLNNTSHLTAQASILARSAFRSSAVLMELSTMIYILMCFQVISDSRFIFLNSFKLNLEERHLACGFKCTPRNLLL